MKHLLSVLFFFLLTFSNAQESALLWKIEGDSIDQPSYLFGTIHMIPKKEYFFPNYMKDAFKSCEQLIMEINLNEVSLKDQLSVASTFFLDKNIDQYVSKNKLADYRTYLQDTLKMKAKKVDKLFLMKPFYASSLIYKKAIGKFKAYEKELNKMATKQKMSVSGLETFREQINIINSLSVKDQFESTPYSSVLINEYYKLLEDYKKQNLSVFWTMMQEESEDVLNELLINRNKRWIPKIEMSIREKPAFIAVGAAHLAGPEGVIELLKKQGYQVTPVFSSLKLTGTPSF